METHTLDNQPRGTHWERDEEGSEFYRLIGQKRQTYGGTVRIIHAPFIVRNRFGTWSAFQNGPHTGGIERFETAEAGMRSLNTYFKNRRKSK